MYLCIYNHYVCYVFITIVRDNYNIAFKEPKSDIGGEG